MRPDDVSILIECLPRTEFAYERDRFALQVLSWAVGEGRAVQDIKNTRFGPLLQRPCVRAVTARLGDARLTRDRLLASHEPETRWTLTYGRWGTQSGWTDDQVSRPGANLVLHLNLGEAARRRFAKLRGKRGCNPWTSDWHPHARRSDVTFAWARLDVDLDLGEALIEEIQTDWLPEILWDADRVRAWSRRRAETWLHEEFESTAATRDAFLSFIDEYIRPIARTWDEAVLSAALRVLREDMGIRRVWYHTFEGGQRMKHIDGLAPPRSLYTRLPRRFCFEVTGQPPTFLLWSDTACVRRVSRTVRWYRLEL